jgi:hypothetical protein
VRHVKGGTCLVADPHGHDAGGAGPGLPHRYNLPLSHFSLLPCTVFDQSGFFERDVKCGKLGGGIFKNLKISENVE